MTATTSVNPLTAFQWKPQPEAFALVQSLVNGFLNQSRYAATLAKRMKDETGTRFIDWVDHIVVGSTPQIQDRLAAAGFNQIDSDADGIYLNDGGIFPAIILTEDLRFELAIKVGSVVDFAVVNVLPFDCAEPPVSLCRKLRVRDGDGLWAVQRNGFRGFVPPRVQRDRVLGILKHYEIFRTRNRHWSSDEEGFAHTASLVDAAVSELGPDIACDIFFAAERVYWMSRNRAAQVQYARQQRLGLGWANHDHHTYRCSRANFTKLIAIWESMGFSIRERYHAGKEAGWGAQVMEQPHAGIVTFNDVDLTPDELFNDFAHEPLAQQSSLGTVGLWCALHGDSLLQAGMHHLECMFDFESLRSQLEAEDRVKTMKPFTWFPYLKQAFTEGQRWPVATERIDRALRNGWINQDQASQFRTQGAIGSHLENLERNDGFKGFNQTGVSEIISATDPRKHSAR